MKTETPKLIKLTDYKKPDYRIEKIDLTINLDDTQTQVESKMLVVCQGEKGSALVLNGEELKLLSLKVNGSDFKTYRLDEEQNVLILNDVPEKFELTIKNEINPLQNKTLDGLYKSGSIFCTQNEPEGFRRITYYIDRPDNMAKFTTKIIADKIQYPVLLSNGNPIEKGELAGGKHFVLWEDPFYKPSYLYALVAGDLGVIRDHYMTKSKRNVLLEIYCDKGNESKCYHAMESLKKSMKWDEERFGLEYDLDIYMIVAVDSFNMGAMENKGLNIFNSALVLADQKTATDNDFYRIESVVGHEYFHNWTGNRVTCRDWFQLTLKEGLTVYRDQEFSADLNSRSVERIKSVMALRSKQFDEDQGPTSHPIKPSTYIEINNFYTATVYEKGAEVIRMMATLLGTEGFRRGMDKYFELFDGQAVCTEDFLHAMSVANNNYDFSQFALWYAQNGTPEISVTQIYNEKQGELTLNIKQILPKNTKNTNHPNLPPKYFHLPLAIGLLNQKGETIVEKVIDLKNENENFVFTGLNEKPYLSLNRNFSAPVKLHSDMSFSDHLFIMAHDQDAFNRFESMQTVSTQVLLQMISDKKAGLEFKIDQNYIASFGKILTDINIDDAFKSLSISLPEEGILHQEQDIIDYEATYAARVTLKKKLAENHKDVLLEIYKRTSQLKDYKLDPHSMGQRELKNACLSYLLLSGEKRFLDLAVEQFSHATNMTDEIAALNGIIAYGQDKNVKNQVIAAFYKKWKHETLVMQKWITAQMLEHSEDVYESILRIETDPVYDQTVPNLVRALHVIFVNYNKFQFNHSSGKGYRLIADRVIALDQINPQVASRLALGFKDFKRTSTSLQMIMKSELERILKVEMLSKNVYEIVSKIINS